MYWEKKENECHDFEIIELFSFLFVDQFTSVPH